VRVLLEDAEVDAAVVGVVPVTPALQTLAAGPGHAEDGLSAAAVLPRLTRLWQESRKPWVLALDGGTAYDASRPMPRRAACRCSAAPTAPCAPSRRSAGSCWPDTAAGLTLY